MSGGWSAWPAPAKLNLFLRITGRRDDGYHELQTVFRLLEWGDTIRLRPRVDGRIERQGESLPGVAAADDLAVRAAKLLQQEVNSNKGVDIIVSASRPAAASVVVRPMRRPCSARSTGSGGWTWARTAWPRWACAWGRTCQSSSAAARPGPRVGERLQPLDLPPAWYLLVDPGVHVPTAGLFRAPDLTRNAAPAKMADFVAGTVLDNAFEPVLRRLEPAVEAAFDALAQVGQPRLTGSGGGCFVEFADRAGADAALARLPRGLRAWVAAGVARSPLRAALAGP